MGNMLLQLIALDQLPDVAAGRELIRKTETLKTYGPKSTAAETGRTVTFKTYCAKRKRR